MMISCPTCGALLVEVTPTGGTGRQFICGCPQTTWFYRETGDLEHVAVSDSTVTTSSSEG
jgi:hypothetical protein